MDAVTDAVVEPNVKSALYFVDFIQIIWNIYTFGTVYNWGIESNLGSSKLTNEINMPKICVKAPEIIMSGE